MVYALTNGRCGLAVPADPAKQSSCDKLCIKLDDLYRNHHKKSITLQKMNRLYKSATSS